MIAIDFGGVPVIKDPILPLMKRDENGDVVEVSHVELQVNGHTVIVVHPDRYDALIATVGGREDGR